MKQITAKDVDTVRCWIETTPHHKCSSFPMDSHIPTHIVLEGHHNRLRVPVALYKKCHMAFGGHYDNRMYRWDHAAELVAIRSAKDKTDG